MRRAQFYRDRILLPYDKPVTEAGVKEDQKQSVFRTKFGKRLFFATLFGGAVSVLLSLPMPVLPEAPPPLRFHWPSVADVLSEYENAEADDTLDALLFDYGRAENGPGESAEAFEARRTATVATVSSLEPEALDNLRRYAAQRMLTAIDSGVDEVDEDLVGAFPRMLERYEVREEAAFRTHRLVALALAHARFNGIMERPLTEGMSDVVEQAYYGHLALASSAPLAMRRDALTEFAAVGGLDADEAAAWLAYQADAIDEAAVLYRRAAEESGNTRLRNHALALEALLNP